MIQTFLAGIFLILCGGSALAQNPQGMQVYDYNQNAADLGRGGVHSFDPEVGSSFMNNPAILGFVKGFRWSILDVQAGLNGMNTYNLIEQHPISEANLPYYYGQNIWAGAAGYSALAIANFGIAAYGNTYVDALVHNPAYTQVQAEGILDYGLMVGTGFMIGDQVAFGVNIKNITREGGTTTLGPAQVTNISSSSVQQALTAQGDGYGLDTGLMWRGNSVFNPVVSVDWKDVGWTSFHPATGQPGPPVLQDNLTVGFNVGQSIAGVGWMAGFELRHLLQWSLDAGEKVFMGGEIDLALIDVRAGLYQGYGTYGLSTDLWLFTVDAAAYSAELGDYASQYQDQRYEAGIRFEASFDANFINWEVGGKKRRLKQRR